MKPSLKTRILPFVAEIKDRKISGRFVADYLGVSESWVSKVLKEMGVKRDRVESRSEIRRLKEARIAHRTKAAKTMSVADAAKACNVHPRTIARLLDSLKD